MKSHRNSFHYERARPTIFDSQWQKPDIKSPIVCYSVGKKVCKKSIDAYLIQKTTNGHLM